MWLSPRNINRCFSGCDGSNIQHILVRVSIEYVHLYHSVGTGLFDTCKKTNAFSPPPYLSLSLLISLHPSLSLSTPPHLSLSILICLPLLLSLSPSLSLSLPPYLSPSFLISLHPSSSLSFHPYLSPPPYLSPSLLISLPLLISLHPSLSLSPSLSLFSQSCKKRKCYHRDMSTQGDN